MEGKVHGGHLFKDFRLYNRLFNFKSGLPVKEAKTFYLVVRKPILMAITRRQYTVL